jgi:hypothetical protein
MKMAQAQFTQTTVLTCSHAHTQVYDISLPPLPQLPAALPQVAILHPFTTGTAMLTGTAAAAVSADGNGGGNGGGDGASHAASVARLTQLAWQRRTLGPIVEGTSQRLCSTDYATSSMALWCSLSAVFALPQHLRWHVLLSERMVQQAMRSASHSTL